MVVFDTTSINPTNSLGYMNVRGLNIDKRGNIWASNFGSLDPDKKIIVFDRNEYNKNNLFFWHSINQSGLGSNFNILDNPTDIMFANENTALIGSSKDDGLFILKYNLDSDNDGIADDVDTCPFTQQGQEVDSNGCSQYQKDDDQDGVSNAEDLCAATPYQETVDANGCSDSQKETDTDGDGLRDPYDLCPGSDNEQPVDENCCNLSQKDTDGDGVNDLVDECPDTGPSIPVLADGCVDESALDEDIDGDGYKGLYSYDSETETHTGDAFPTDSTQRHDLDGDGYGDNPDGTQPDSCPTEFGNSTEKSRYGCLDTDGDGYHDGLGDDKFPTDPSQWEDRDLDTWGDNPEGSNPDECPDTDTSPRYICLLYTSPSPRDRQKSRMPSSA